LFYNIPKNNLAFKNVYLCHNPCRIINKNRSKNMIASATVHQTTLTNSALPERTDPPHPKPNLLITRIQEIWEKIQDFPSDLLFDPIEAIKGLFRERLPLPTLPFELVLKIATLTTEPERGHLLQVNKQWHLASSLARIDHIKTLRSNEKLHEFFPFFFPPLPTQTISHSQTAQIEHNIHDKVRVILLRLRKKMPEAEVKEFKNVSVSAIAEDPKRLTKLLKTAYDYSLVQPFSITDDTTQTFAQKAEIVRASLRERAAEIVSLSLRTFGMLCFPSEFCELPALQYLDLSHNGLCHLHDAIGSLSRLTVLRLSGNCLSRLPRAFENLTSLVVLDLSYNRFTELPEPLLQLNNLLELCVIENKFISHHGVKNQLDISLPNLKLIGRQ